MNLNDQLYAVLHDPQGSRTWQAFFRDGRCIVIAPDYSFHSVHQSSVVDEDRPYLVDLSGVPEPVLAICRGVLRETVEFR
ncbi:MAG: hypothetical protein KGJ21_02735 [Pseudomonadota bacterium]|nr:hypothetical protein [Pseudomonadota bacterium]